MYVLSCIELYTLKNALSRLVTRFITIFRKIISPYACYYLSPDGSGFKPCTKCCDRSYTRVIWINTSYRKESSVGNPTTAIDGVFYSTTSLLHRSLLIFSAMKRCGCRPTSTLNHCRYTRNKPTMYPCCFSQDYPLRCCN